MSAPATPPPAGWYPDPAGRAPFRYWDGARWTEHTQQSAAPTGASPGMPPGSTAQSAWPPVPPAPAGTPTPPAPSYLTGGVFATGGVATQAPPPTTRPLTGPAFVEELQRFEGWAVVVVGFLLFLVSSFLPWTGGEVSGPAGSEASSSNAWDGDGPWLVRGFDVTEQNVVTAANGGSVDSGTDMVVMLPLALAAVGVAVAIRTGKRFTMAAEVGLGVSALFAILVIAEAAHASNATGDLVRILESYGVQADGGLKVGFFLAIAAALIVVAGAARTFQAARRRPVTAP